jgi:DNA (cytosine-5)-methyltransferase 1
MPRKNSYITITDQFCGAGGSSIGATKAGAELRLAMNHWQLAIDTHNTNFPQADHDCADISASNPRKYPSTDILITSPECTNHSLAKGKPRRFYEKNLWGDVLMDPAEERSRATMWDVPRFADFTGQFAHAVRPRQLLCISSRKKPNVHLRMGSWASTPPETRGCVSK